MIDDCKLLALMLSETPQDQTPSKGLPFSKHNILLLSVWGIGVRWISAYKLVLRVPCHSLAPPRAIC